MSTSPLTVPTIRFTLNLDVPVGVALDFHTYWSQVLQSGQIGTLAAAMTAADTTLPLATVSTQTQPGQVAAPNPGALLGKAVYCDGEVMIVSGWADNAFSVIRSPHPPLDFLLTAPNQAHAAGAAVYGLQYLSPFHWMADMGLWPLAKQVSDALRLSGHTYATAISGSISLTPSGS